MNEPAKIFTGDLDAATLQRYLEGGFLAVDTETLGLNVHRDRLCVVQMCNEAGEASLVLVEGQQAPHLKELLEAPSVEKVFHYARFDLATLRHWLGIRVQPFYCTKIASRLVRTYTAGHGLKNLTHELLGIPLDKEQQSSDWAARPLSPQQVAYAASDVLHLIPLRHKLDAMLQREGRRELARACMDFLPTRVELDLAGWEQEDIFAHS